MIYGYVRVSTDKQNIDRQIRNILAVDASAKIYQEIFTGTKTTGRHEFQKLLNKVQSGDTIIFDSVSRMSRNASEGFELYKKLFDDGVNLVFINELYINTDVYKATRDALVPMTNTDVDLILAGVNQYLMKLAEKQVELAFQQAQKERDDLSERTKQGLQTAKLNGKQLGRAKGTVIKLLGIDKNTYYKYKKELKSQIAG